MANLKAVLRWVTFLPAAFVAGLLASILLGVVAYWSMVAGGGIEPDSPEYAVMMWMYHLFGEVAFGAVAVWVAWVWAPSRKLGAALASCLLWCALSGALVYLRLTGRATLQAFETARVISGAVGALLAMGYLVGEHQGDRDWFDKAVTGGWHGFGGPAHVLLSILATVPLWWQAADPVGGWRESTSGTSLVGWAVGAVGWIWHLAVMGVVCYIAAFATVALLLLALKLPFIVLYQFARRASHGSIALPETGEGVTPGGCELAETNGVLTPDSLAFAGNVVFRPTIEEVEAARERLRSRREQQEDSDSDPAPSASDE